MNVNESGPSRPLPKPPATGADAWKNKPTNCWPTPANMDAAREFSSPLDPNYGSEGDLESVATGPASGDTSDDVTASEHPAFDDPASEDTTASDDEAEATWEDEGGAEEDNRPSLAADDEIPARFRDAVVRLDDVAQRPVTSHAESYDAVHRDLRSALDDVER